MYNLPDNFRPLNAYFLNQTQA